MNISYLLPKVFGEERYLLYFSGQNNLP